MTEDLEGLDELEVTISFRASQKVFARLEEVAKLEGRKPGPMARYILEVGLGFRKPSTVSNLDLHFSKTSKKKRAVNR